MKICEENKRKQTGRGFYIIYIFHLLENQRSRSLAFSTESSNMFPFPDVNYKKTLVHHCKQYLCTSLYGNGVHPHGYLTRNKKTLNFIITSLPGCLLPHKLRGVVASLHFTPIFMVNTPLKFLSACHQPSYGLAEHYFLFWPPL